MLTCFSIRLTVVAAIAVLAVSAASIPKLKGKEGITIPLIKRSPLLSSKKSINIDGLKSCAASYSAKLLQGLDNYERNTGATHPSALKWSRPRNWKRGGAELDLTGHRGDLWYGTILIGTPPKPFTVQIDTGSSDLFIPASTGDLNCKSHDNLWNPASSGTAQGLDKPFELEFGDGAYAQGKQYTDKITIAGFTADKETIGVATTCSDNLDKSQFPSDGLLGLAFRSISTYSASPLLQTLVSEGKLPDGMFSLKLTSDGGEMYIGGVNEKSYTGDITFVDVPTKAFWQVIVDDIRVNGKPILTNIVSIIDTGANYILGDPSRVLTLHQAYGGEAFEDGWYTFRCDDFPDVTLTFGGKPFTIPANVLNLGPVVDNSPDCFSGIVAHDLPVWSIGSNFLQLFYTVFDMGSDPARVGFAHLE